MDSQPREGGKRIWDAKGIYKEDKQQLMEKSEVRQRRHVNNHQKEKGMEGLGERVKERGGKVNLYRGRVSNKTKRKKEG